MVERTLHKDAFSKPKYIIADSFRFEHKMQVVLYSEIPKRRHQSDGDVTFVPKINAWSKIQQPKIIVSVEAKF